MADDLNSFFAKKDKKKAGKKTTVALKYVSLSKLLRSALVIPRSVFLVVVWVKIVMCIGRCGWHVPLGLLLCLQRWDCAATLCAISGRPGNLRKRPTE